VKVIPHLSHLRAFPRAKRFCASALRASEVLKVPAPAKLAVQTRRRESPAYSNADMLGGSQRKVAGLDDFGKSLEHLKSKIEVLRYLKPIKRRKPDLEFQTWLDRRQTGIVWLLERLASQTLRALCWSPSKLFSRISTLDMTLLQPGGSGCTLAPGLPWLLARGVHRPAGIVRIATPSDRKAGSTPASRGRRPPFLPGYGALEVVSGGRDRESGERPVGQQVGTTPARSTGHLAEGFNSDRLIPCAIGRVATAFGTR